MARIVFAVSAAPSQWESSAWLGTLWLLRGPAWRHPRWSSWSPLRPTFGCFDSMEARSRFVLKMAFWIFTKIYIWYSINSCLRFTWSDQFHNEFDFCCCLGWFTLQKCRISTFWILEFLEKRRSICWTARSIAQIEVLFPTLLEKLFWWFQWSRGSNLWPNNTVNTKFCVKIFLGARISQPPQNALYHTVQMVLVDPCDRLISRFS